MKKKFLLPILSVCMVVALVSVGFAAWLITGSHTEDATGSFVTHDVTNEYFTAKAEVDGTGEGKIEFGKGSATTTNSTPWFTFDGASNEILEATFKITVTPDVAGNLTKILSKNNIKVTLKAKDAKYDAAVAKGIVAQPTISCGSDKTATATNLATGVSITLTADNFTAGVATVKVNFKWGTNGNPYTYYNNTHTTAEAAGSDVRTTATTAIETLHEINGQQYDIILEVVPVSTGD